jgi:hypothetical protein
VTVNRRDRQVAHRYLIDALALDIPHEAEILLSFLGAGLGAGFGLISALYTERRKDNRLARKDREILISAIEEIRRSLDGYDIHSDCNILLLALDEARTIITIKDFKTLVILRTLGGALKGARDNFRYLSSAYPDRQEAGVSDEVFTSIVDSAVRDLTLKLGEAIDELRESG